MNAAKTMTPTCSHCGEPRTEDQPHDAQRCWTIARAIVTVGRNTATEAERNIVELRRWLEAHPAPTLAQGIKARQDRELALTRWIAHAQRTDAVINAWERGKRALLARAGTPGEWTRPQPK